MKGFSNTWVKTGVAAIAAAALAIPMASAFAVAVDPTQAPVAEAAEEAAPADVALTEEQIVTGRQLFQDWSCSACHALVDANGHGHIGPALDGNDMMDKEFVVSRVTNGQGAMPGFGGQMTEDEIDLLSAYIVHAKK